jgi:hypothetical protein
MKCLKIELIFNGMLRCKLGVIDDGIVVEDSGGKGVALVPLTQYSI